ncbi:MAG: hypothetical protein HYX47_02600 [Burkholderiales bacterium]|nr:hypothetical protein [Burkholderiales bacterium]
MRRAPIEAALLSLATAAAAAPADDIKALLEQGRDRQAYEAGRAAPQQLGDPLFDFYFGIAALNAGVPGEGVLALERYLLRFPDNRAAQFQLARGYFILGEDLRARDEFQALVAGAKPEELESINRFLDAIRARESRYKPTATAFAEVGVGWDSNINSGVASGQIAGLPDGFVVSPGQTSEKQRDSFRSVAAGVQGTYPLRPGLALYGGATVAARAHSKNTSDVFDQETFAVQGGLSYLQGRSLYRLGLDLTTLNVDHQHYLDVTTVAGEWQYQADQFNRFSMAGQWSRQAYKSVDSFLDLDKTTPVAAAADVRSSGLASVTGSWNRTFEHDWNPALNISLNLAQEKNRRDRPDLSRNLWGLRIGGTSQPAPRWTLAAGLGWQASRYGAEFAAGLETRRDQLASADVSLAYAVDRNWSVRTEYQHNEQRSNIGLYRYTRDAVALKLRYDMN